MPKWIWFLIAVGIGSGVWFITAPSKAQELVYDNPKLVWGGGPVAVSSYSGKIVPVVISQLEANRMAGYSWAGPSEGSVMNALMVTMNPTHLGLCQADICDALNGTPIPGMDGVNYAFTTVQEDIGDECLYLVTKSPYYETWGHVLENAWDISIATGGKLSGSYGTLQNLMRIYPDLQDAVIENVGGTGNIVQSVLDDKTNFGFFVMRPDPENAIFQTINDAGLTLVPVIDFDLEGIYQFRELKVSSSKWFGFGGSAKYQETACTQVQLITGDPNQLSADQARLERRLNATITRVGEIDSSEFKNAVVEQFTTLSDYFDSVREVGGERIRELAEAARQKIEEVAN